MRTRRPWLATLVVASACMSVTFVDVTALAQAQQAQPQAQQQQEQSPAPPASDSSTPVFKAETRLVLVDTVVTDKKGNYITGLTAKDFKVWEDNKEQPIKSFSAEAGSAAPSEDHRHYLVLLFDNSTISFADQARARDAAAKFVEANAGPDRYIAIMNFGGTLSVALNFTADAERLKQVVRNVKFSSVSPNAQPTEVASLGAPQLGNAEANFGARTLLLALRSVAKSLASVPGRKSLILMTAGFSMTPGAPDYFERQSELMAVIDACNKANVAVYPIDVRGLTGGMSAAPGSARLRDNSRLRPARLVTATLDYSADDQPAHLVYVQRGGGGRWRRRRSRSWRRRSRRRRNWRWWHAQRRQHRNRRHRNAQRRQYGSRRHWRSRSRGRRPDESGYVWLQPVRSITSTYSHHSECRR